VKTDEAGGEDLGDLVEALGGRHPIGIEGIHDERDPLSLSITDAAPIYSQLVAGSCAGAPCTSRGATFRLNRFSRWYRRNQES
jgi:hypothetical protein